MKMHCVFVHQTIDNEDYLQPSLLKTESIEFIGGEKECQHLTS